MKRLALALFAASLLLPSSPAFAAPAAILTRVSEGVTVQRGGKALPGKNGLALQSGDKVVVASGSATVFTLGSPPKTIHSGSIVVGSAGGAKSGSPALWNTVYSGLQRGLTSGNRTVVAAMRNGDGIVAVTPLPGKSTFARPRFVWSLVADVYWYEVVVSQNGKEIYRGQSQFNYLDYPTTAPTLTGKIDWQVTALTVLKDKLYVAGPDSPKSPLTTFEVASPAQMQQMRDGLIAINTQLKSASPTDRYLMRASFLHELGFNEAALGELQNIEVEGSAKTLRRALWLATGQKSLVDWEIINDKSKVPMPSGAAQPRYLALVPDGPFQISEVKNYVDPDRVYSLDLPATFCVFRTTMPEGGHLAEFAAGPRGGTRLTIAYGTTKEYSQSATGDKGTLLSKLGELLKKLNVQGGASEYSFTVNERTKIKFLGGDAWESKITQTANGAHVLCQSLEWTANGTNFVAFYGDGYGDLKAAKAMRPLMDSIKLGSQVPAPPPVLNEKDFLDLVQAEMAAKRTEFDRLMVLSDTNRQEAPETGDLPDLDAFEKAMQATPESSYERVGASLRAARRAAQLAGEASAKGDTAAADKLFARSVELQNQSNATAVAALEEGIKADDLHIKKWMAYTPPQNFGEFYNFVLRGWREVKTMRLNMLQSRAKRRGASDLTDEYAQRYFDGEYLYYVDRRLSFEAPNLLYQQMVAVGAAFDSLAAASQAHADLDGARAYYARALLWRQAVPKSYDDRDVYLSLGNRASLELQIGDLGLARDYYQQAIDDQVSAGPSRMAVIAAMTDKDNKESTQVNWDASRAFYFNNLGTVLKRLGNYEKGEEQYRLALKAEDDLGTTGFGGGVRANMRAATLSNLSVLYCDSGDLKKGAQYLDEATTLYRGMGNQDGLASTLFSAARIAYNLEQMPEAKLKLAEARSLYTALERPLDIVDCDVLDAQIAGQENAPDREAALGRVALKSAEATGDNRKIATAARVLVWGLLNQSIQTGIPADRVAEIEGLIKRALTADAKSGQSEDLVMLYNLQARFAFMRGQNEEALTFEKAAIARNEAVRATVATADAFSSQDTVMQMYRRAVLILLKLKRPEEAFDMMSRARTQRLRATLTLTAMESPDPQMQALLKKAAALDEKLAKVKLQLAEVKAQPAETRDPTQVQNLESLISSTQAQFFDVSADIKSKNPRFDQVLSMNPTELKKAQKSIPPGSVLLQYAPLDTGLFVFAVTRNSLKIFQPQVGTQELNKSIRAYRAIIDNEIKALGKGEPIDSIDDPNSPIRKASEQLSKWLIEPVRSEIDAANTVAIVPSGELFYLPFHALGHAGKDGKWRFLIEEKPVAYLAKGDVLNVGLSRDLDETSKGILAMGDPVGANLPAAKAEVEGIARIFPDSKALTGAGANKTTLLLPGSREMRVLHLAAHGVLNSQRPDMSYIQLSPDGKDDGKLRVGEILGIDLNKVDLVTLSACQTALGEGEPDGTEISSLAQSFSTAGTPTVIASLWNVEDDSTQHLMESFYGSLANGVGKGASLQQAQVALLKDAKTRQPVFWAPFEMIGDWR